MFSRVRGSNAILYLAVVVVASVGATVALQQAGLDQRFQPGGQDVRGNAQVVLEVAEPRRPRQQRLTQDQQAPALPDDFQGSCDRAVLTVIRLSEHGRSLAPTLAS
jgi:hypothetical protein